jgi:NADPH-dependent 7-cyano-7-deazaguanine reductase QueF
MIGRDCCTKVTIQVKLEEKFTGEVELTYAPDLSIMDNLVLTETIRAIVEDLDSEEETIRIIGDTLVELLKPLALYVIMKINYLEDRYKVEVNYEFNKTGTYKIRRE